jgi:hypothetical protein
MGCPDQGVGHRPSGHQPPRPRDSGLSNGASDEVNVGRTVPGSISTVVGWNEPFRQAVAMRNLLFVALGAVLGVGGSVLASPGGDSLPLKEREAILTMLCERAKQVMKRDMEVNEKILKKSNYFVDSPIAARAAAHVDSLQTIDKIFCMKL